MPAFSVVIPCYNAAATLDETLASVVSQTITDIEIIVVDDGSTDDTARRLADWSRGNPRIRVRGVGNGGPSRARNLGVAAARSPWIAFLDADDIWLPDKLASVAETIAKAPEADAVFGRIAFFRQSGDVNATTSTVRAGRATLDELIGENPVCTLSNLSIRREVFLAAGGFEETLSHSEDLEFLIRLHMAGHSLFGTPDLHVRYRASEGGLSADLLEMHEGWRRAIAATGTAVSASRRARAEAVHLRYLARRALRIGAPASTALLLAARGLRLSPTAFLGGRHRGPATLAACLAAPFLPLHLRRRAFA